MTISLDSLGKIIPKDSDVRPQDIVDLGARVSDGDLFLLCSQNNRFQKRLKAGGRGLLPNEKRLAPLLGNLVGSALHWSHADCRTRIDGNPTVMVMDPATSIKISDIQCADANEQASMAALAQRVSDDGMTVSVGQLRGCVAVLTDDELNTADRLVQRFFPALEPVTTRQKLSDGVLNVTFSLTNSPCKPHDWRQKFGFAAGRFNEITSLEIQAPPGTKVLVAAHKAIGGIEYWNADFVREVPVSGKLVFDGQTPFQNFNGKSQPRLGELHGPSCTLAVVAVAEPDGSGPAMPEVVGKIGTVIPRALAKKTSETQERQEGVAGPETEKGEARVASSLLELALKWWK